MQFRAEDVEALRSRTSGEEELVFADALEDDTGMVTEELSDEDTLLVEDDEIEEEDELVAAAPRVASRSRRDAITAQGGDSEPGWVIAAAVLGFVALLWGALIAWDITAQAKPGDSVLTKPWAKAK
jgi:hypothetical protein